MRFARLRQSLIVSLGGASLFDDLRPGEAEAVLGGKLALASQPIGTALPWSALGLRLTPWVRFCSATA